MLVLLALISLQLLSGTALALSSSNFNWIELLAPHRSNYLSQYAYFREAKVYDWDTLILNKLHRGGMWYFKFNLDAYDAFPNMYLSALRVSESTSVSVEENIRLWSAEMNQTYPLSTANERAVLKIFAKNVENIVHWASEKSETPKNYQLLRPIISAAELALPFMDIICIGLETRSLDSIDVVAALKNLTKNVKTQKVLLRYYQDTLQQLLARDGACSYMHSKALELTIDGVDDLKAAPGFRSRLRIVQSTGDTIVAMTHLFLRRYYYNMVCIPNSGHCGLASTCIIRDFKYEETNGKNIPFPLTMTRVLCGGGPGPTVGDPVGLVRNPNHELEFSSSDRSWAVGCSRLPLLYTGYNTVIVFSMGVFSRIEQFFGLSRAQLTQLHKLEAKDSSSTQSDAVFEEGDVLKYRYCSANDNGVEVHPRLLQLGLGGGDLLSFILLENTCLGIDAVELSSSVVEVAVDYFGILACHVEYFSGSECAIDDMSADEETCMSSREQVMYPADCRSRIFVGDAWDALSILRSRNETYDFIVSDVFDLSTGRHSAHAGLGNPEVIDDMLNSILKIKELLNPESGIAFFHLHKDEKFDKIVAILRSTFANCVFESTFLETSGVFLCSLDSVRFRIPSRVSSSGGDRAEAVELRQPCDNLEEVAAAFEAYGESRGFRKESAKSIKYTINCLV